MDEDWDLHAVVRGCTAPAAIATSDGPVKFSRDLCFEPAAVRRSDHEELLHEIYKPFMFKSSECSRISISPQSFPIINSPPLSVFPDLTQRLPFTFSKNTVSHNHPTPKPKKRKNHMKRVCHVAAENLSSDVWSWRKYGQKPIKGSPYPRGYYRCSTSKGCQARKQVERNRSDPEMFIVTYTADHNHPAPTHRNSLAGSTRQKQPNSEESAKSHSSTEKMESSPEEGESEICLEDDFFAGLEDLAAQHSGDFSANVGFSWLSTTVAGGD